MSKKPSVVITDSNLLQIQYETKVFSGGEVSVKLLKTHYPWSLSSFTFVWNPTNSDDIMELAQLKDAIDHEYHNRPVDLVIGYLPYARQDRYCDKGESFSLRVFAKIINSLGFRSILLTDPHSDVSPALIDNSYINYQHEVIDSDTLVYQEFFTEDFVVVSPDAGAVKKSFAYAQKHGLDFICAEKIRDVKTNKIIRTEVNQDKIKDKNVLILDDILDYGNTFKELGKVLKEGGAKKVVLYITHGIFAGGVDCFEGIIDKIYCAYPWMENVEGKNNLNILVTKTKEEKV